MASGELNLRDYWLILRKRRWVALAALVSVLSGTVIYTRSLTPIYQATADVRIVERKALGNLMEAFLTTGSMGDPMLSQTKVIQSYAVLEQAAHKLG